MFLRRQNNVASLRPNDHHPLPVMLNAPTRLLDHVSSPAVDTWLFTPPLAMLCLLKSTAWVQTDDALEWLPTERSSGSCAGIHYLGASRRGGYRHGADILKGWGDFGVSFYYCPAAGSLPLHRFVLRPICIAFLSEESSEALRSS